MKLPVTHGLDKKPQFGGFGKKMMEKMGWTTGKGLGKEESGMSACIEVKKKDDQRGVGSSTTWDWQEKWWENAFNSAVGKKIGGMVGGGSGGSDSDSSESQPAESKAKRQAVEKSKKDSGSDDSDSDEDLHKLQSITMVVSGRDGIRTTATASDLAIFNELSKDAWGRFGGRNGKMARIKQQEAEMAAKMYSQLNGGALPPAEAPCHSTVTVEETKRKRKEEREQRKKAKKAKKAAEAEAEAETAKKKSKKGKKRSKKASAASESEEEDAHPGLGGGGGGEEEEAPKAKTTAPSCWKPPEKDAPQSKGAQWWTSMFVRAGHLGSRLDGTLEEEEDQEEAKAGGREKGFTEKDQEDLYMSAHKGKMQGKRGLGVMGGEIRIEGGKYEGKKMRFDEGGGEAGSKKKKDKKKKGGKETAAAADEEGGGRDGAQSKKGAPVKWKRLLMQVIQSEPGRKIRLKKLEKKVLALLQDGAVSKADVRGEVLKKVESSSKFSICEEGKVVSMS